MKRLFVLNGVIIVLGLPFTFENICNEGQGVLSLKEPKAIAEIQDKTSIKMVNKSDSQLNVAQPKSAQTTVAKPVLAQKKVSDDIISKEDSLQKNSVVSPSKPIKKPVERTILISNEITKDMITYKKHWTGHYTPSKFILMVNGQEVAQDSTKPITVIDDKICANFDYEFKVFGKVQRAGGRKFEYTIPKEVEKISSTFSWDDPANLVLNKGVLVASKDTVY